MLAEPRKRQKWSVNPRGNTWSNDENKFGQKLMEKMGWEKGKGLGANEDGRKEHVKVSFKADNRGVGCSVNHADNWIAHQDDFNSLLSNLSATHSAPASTCASGDEGETNSHVQSLEQKSKVSKGRVHYMKFTKGKDLSRYRESDMDCILGKRKSKSASNTPQNCSEVNSDADDGKQSKVDIYSGQKANLDQAFGVQTITSGTSVQEYFARKMEELKRARLQQHDMNSSNLSSGEAFVGGTPNQESCQLFTGDRDELPETTSNPCEDDSSKKHKKKQKKLKHKEKQEDTPLVPQKYIRGKHVDEDREVGCQDDENICSPTLENNLEKQKRKSHKQKKSEREKKEISVQEKESKYMSVGFNYDEAAEKKRKTKKRRKMDLDDTICPNNGKPSGGGDGVLEKKSKKKKTNTGIDSQEVEESSETSFSELSVQTNLSKDDKGDGKDTDPIKKDKKKKKRKNENKQDCETSTSETLCKLEVEKQVDASNLGKMSKKKKRSERKPDDVSEDLSCRTTESGSVETCNSNPGCGFPNSNLGSIRGYGGGINIGYSLKNL